MSAPYARKGGNHYFLLYRLVIGKTLRQKTSKCNFWAENEHKAIAAGLAVMRDDSRLACKGDFCEACSNGPCCDMAG